MPFPRRLLTDGEQVVLDLEPHWIRLTGPAAWTVFIGALTGFVFFKTHGTTQDVLRILEVAFAFSLWIPVALAPMISWRFTRFVLTDQRVITRSGVFAKRSREIPLETINDVTFTQSILERIVGAGDLIIESAGESGQNRFTEIPDPEAVQLEIYRASQARKAAARQAPGGYSVADELEKLASLRDRGVLTDEEFQARKQKLLEL